MQGTGLLTSKLNKQQAYIKFDVNDRPTYIKIEYKKHAYIEFDVSVRPHYFHQNCVNTLS